MPVAATKAWTLEALDRLPDDGNTYEVVHGELFVTPAPGPRHEVVVANLNRVLLPYVEAHRLGGVYFPRAVIQRDGSQTEPDLAVRERIQPDQSWGEIAVPFLVVEVLSPSTRRRDREQKRGFYREIGVEDYWIVDPDDRTVTWVRADRADMVTSSRLEWRPLGTDVPLVIDVPELFA